MWFSIVCTLVDNDICHHSGQNIVCLVSPQQMNIIVDKSPDNAEPHSICFELQYSTPKKKFISEHDQDHDKKERALALYKTFCNLIWLISKNESS